MIHNDPCFESRISHWIMDHCGSLFLIHKDHNVFSVLSKKKPPPHSSTRVGSQHQAFRGLPWAASPRTSLSGSAAQRKVSHVSLTFQWDQWRMPGIFWDLLGYLILIDIEYLISSGIGVLRLRRLIILVCLRVIDTDDGGNFPAPRLYCDTSMNQWDVNSFLFTLVI